jgi:hypothetical protein
MAETMMEERPEADPPPEPSKGGTSEEQALGDPIRVFRSKWTTRASTVVSGIVVLLCGVYVISLGFLDWGVGVLLFGIIVLGLAYLLGQSKYLLCPGGMIAVRLGHTQQCRWEDVGEIVDTRMTQGMVSSRRCALVKKNGSRMEMMDFGIDDFAALVALLRQQAELHRIPWKEERGVQ